MLANQTNSAIVNYSWTFVLMAIVGLFSYNTGDAGGLTALKMIVSPMCTLAMRAVPTFFKEPIVEPRWTWRAVEAHLLTGAPIAAFVALLVWKPESSMWTIVSSFILTMSIMSVMQMIILGLQIRRLRNGEV